MELRSLMRRRSSSKDIIILMNGGLKRFIQYTRAGGISGTEQWSNKDSKTSKLSIAATITSSRWSNLRLLRETPFPPGFLWLSSSSSRSGCICKCKWGSLRVSTTITMLLHCRGRRRLTDHAAVTADPAEYRFLFALIIILHIPELQRRVRQCPLPRAFHLNGERN